MPIDKIFDLVNMDMIVKYFCMQEIKEVEKNRLIDRRFIPQNLINKNGGPQFYDNIEKVMQHHSWKENRYGSSIRTSFSPSPMKTQETENDENMTQFRRISHSSKVTRVVALPSRSKNISPLNA